MASTASTPPREASTKFEASRAGNTRDRPTQQRSSTKGKQASTRGDFPTHFLAIPLVNDKTLPQLAESVKIWQDASTAPKPLTPPEIEAYDRARAEKHAEEIRTGVRSTGGLGPETWRSYTSSRVIPRAAQRPVGTLHLTLGVMTLKSDDENRRALEVLKSTDFVGMLRAATASAKSQVENIEQELKEERERLKGTQELVDGVRAWLAEEAKKEDGYHDGFPVPDTSSDRRAIQQMESDLKLMRADYGGLPPPLRIDLLGLKTFPNNPDSGAVRVFYAEPEDRTDRLQTFAEAIQQRFISEGLVRKENRPLTLHATIANMKYVKTPRGQRAKGKGNKDGTRASSLLDQFNQCSSKYAIEGPFEWGEDIVLDRVRICKMGAVKSENEVMGMEYPAIRVPRGDGEAGESDVDVAEVVFWSSTRGGNTLESMETRQ